MLPYLVIRCLCLALCTLVSYGAIIQAGRRDSSNSFRYRTPAAFREPAVDKFVDNYLTLQRSPAKPSSYRARNNAGQHSKSPRNASPDYPPNLAYLNEQASYNTEIRVCGKPYRVAVDTGSSNTWLVQSGFNCLSGDESDCFFGQAYDGNVSANLVPNAELRQSYGSGEFVSGIYVHEDIGIAKLSVRQQQLGIANTTLWYGDTVTSGVLGLAYPAITNISGGSDAHDPLFTSMYKQNIVLPVFSLAIERHVGGYLAFGGLPPVAVTGDFGRTPILISEVWNQSKTIYAIKPDSLVYGGSTPNVSMGEFWVDSGTSLNYFPERDAAAINALFDPPAIHSRGIYLVDCKATAPDLAITIGGIKFSLNKTDLIFPTRDWCYSGIQASSSHSPNILGDVFLRSVIAVFDVGASEMRFASHIY